VLRRAMTAFAVVVLASCNVVFDRNSDQCNADTDCDKFGGHPSCENHVCVASGLGPEGCVITPPTKQSDYLNACSTSKCVPFDNCARLGLCSSATTLPPNRAPSNPTIPPLVNPVPMPTISCTDGAANVIYMFGAADFAPLLQAAQPLLSASTPPYRAVFQNASSCAGVSAVFDSTKNLMKNPAVPGNGGWAFYFDDSGKQVNCMLATAGNTVDIGVSDLYAPTCSPAFQPGPTVGEYTGPVVPFVLSVPATSNEQSISAEAAHLVFGLGGKASDVAGWRDAMPWTDPNYFFVRNSGAASTVLTSLLADVPRTAFWGVDRLSTENLRDSLLASTAVNQSIGIVSIDYNDKNRGNLRALYLQAKDQKCGYQPDSTATSYDKVNVRDGHYPLWGYVHFFTPLGPGGVPSMAASAMVLRFSVPRVEQSLVDNIIAASLIPQCAMKVVRTSEVGSFAPQTGFQCGCYFEMKTKGKTSCQTCRSSEECPANRSACNYGYCELN
jgi:hypothetical protein